MTDITQKTTYSCGTLRYTLTGLMMAVGLILIGFFSHTYAMSVVNTLIPLKVKESLGADNKTIALMMSTIGGIFNITVCPMVSYKSDRHRSRMGRRIPFILNTLPMYVGSMVMFAFSDSIAEFLKGHLGLANVAPATVTICVIGVAMVIYQFFYMFVGSVIHYIYNDVIPVQFQARVVGAVQVAMALSSTLFNLFLFKHSLNHFRLLMISASGLYVIGIGLMCFLLKEPEYPPFIEEKSVSSKKKVGLLTFAKESFSHRIYWYAFFSCGFIAISGIGSFMVFFNREMGLSLDSIGKLYGVEGMVSTTFSIVGVIVGTILIDRWHPVRIYLFGILLSLLEPLEGIKWLLGTPPTMVFWWSMLLTFVFFRVCGTLYSFASLPMLMRIFPKSRFGQFCSAQAMLRSILTLVFSFLLGVGIDLLKYQCNLGDFAYRYIWLWQLFWMIPGAFCFIKVYCHWKKLGAERYQAPAPWLEDGFEEMPETECVSPNFNWLKWGLRGLTASVIIHLVFALALAFFACSSNDCPNGKLFVCVGMPASCLVGVVFFCVIRRHFYRELNQFSQDPSYTVTLPHYGFLMICSIVSFGLTCVTTFQCFKLINVSLGTWVWCAEAFVLLYILGVLSLVGKLEKQ